MRSLKLTQAMQQKGPPHAQSCPQELCSISMLNEHDQSNIRDVRVQSMDPKMKGAPIAVVLFLVLNFVVQSREHGPAGFRQYIRGGANYLYGSVDHDSDLECVRRQS